MCRGIDAAREARDDDDAVLAQLQRDIARKAPAVRRRIARADDRESVAREQRRVAFDRDQRRRVIERGERDRIIGLAPRDESSAHGLQ